MTARSHTVRVLAAAAAVALAATATTAGAAPGGKKGDPPAANKVIAVGESTATLVDVRCQGNDGTSVPGVSVAVPDGKFIERRATFTGPLVSDDARLSGDLVADIVGVYDAAIGPFSGTWTLTSPLGRASGEIAGTVDEFLVRGLMTGTLADGSRLVANFTATPETAPSGKLGYTFEIGTGSPYLNTAIISSGSCAPYASEPYAPVPPPLG